MILLKFQAIHRRCQGRFSPFVGKNFFFQQPASAGSPFGPPPGDLRLGLSVSMRWMQAVLGW